MHPGCREKSFLMMPVGGNLKDLVGCWRSLYYVGRESLFLSHPWSCDYNRGDEGEKKNWGASE